MKLLSTREAAAQLCISEISIRRMVKDGRLPHVRLGKSVRIQQEVLDKLVRSSKQVGQ
jgi:excisionase family DNA binding protein